jgi:hypothetical protein
MQGQRISRIMKNYESLRTKKEIIRDEVYQLVETITTKYNEEVGILVK